MNKEIGRGSGRRVTREESARGRTQRGEGAGWRERSRKHRKLEENAVMASRKEPHEDADGDKGQVEQREKE